MMPSKILVGFFLFFRVHLFHNLQNILPTMISFQNNDLK